MKLTFMSVRFLIVHVRAQGLHAEVHARRVTALACVYTLRLTGLILVFANCRS